MHEDILMSMFVQTTIKGGGTGTGRSCSWSPGGDMLAITSYGGPFSIWKMIENDFVQLDDFIQQEVL